MKYFWKEILSFTPAMIFPILAGILIDKFVNLYSLSYFLGSGIIYIIIFSISMWFIGMNQYEKDLIGKPILGLIRRIYK